MSMVHKKKLKILALLAALGVVTASVLLSSCGSDDKSDAASQYGKISLSLKVAS